MEIKSWLYTLFVLIGLVIASSFVDGLRSGGKHVLSRYRLYYTTERTSDKVLKSRQTCWYSGWWWGRSRRCRYVYYYVTVTKYKSVGHYRVEYYCATGYEESSGECRAVCDGGCYNGGTCVRPGYCSCSRGWDGTDCDDDIDECRRGDYYACGSHSNCRNTQGSYYCRCDSGYRSSSGKNCRDINECDGGDYNACGSNSRCTDTNGSYRCNCKTGFSSSSGRHCTDKNECSQSHGCQHQCVNTDGSYKCTCKVGYYLTSGGRRCADHDECRSNNGGCSQICNNFIGGYGCACRKGYELRRGSLKRCTDVDECTKGNSGCSHTCKNTIGSFLCSCRTGYSLAWDKKSCKDVDECKGGGTGCAQICTNTPGSYYCGCKPGFDLRSDKKKCEDKNECQANHGCQYKCVNTIGSYKCTCDVGHYLASDGRSCTDRDECLSNNGGCSQDCNNYPGGYNCACRKGYKVSKGNLKECTDNNECLVNNGGCSQDCNNYPGGYNCACRKGYEVSKGNSKTCTDIDECTTGSAGCSHTCKNTIGSFICSCKNGYNLAADKKICEDVNECEQKISGCAQICVNMLGGYYCSCKPGFDLLPDKKNCEDNNECQDNHGCEHKCVNTIGSYNCICNVGHFLASDGKTCTDKNECLSNNGGCGQDCNNYPGGYNCACRKGYEVSKGNLKTCTDVDECTTGSSGCSHTCKNTIGSFICSCRSGYNLADDKKVCEDVDECNQNLSGCAHTCVNTPGSYYCSCKSGFDLMTDQKNCVDKDECQANHGCEHNCVNTKGSYKCECNVGHFLASDGRKCTDHDECYGSNGGCSQICNNFPGGYKCACHQGYQVDIWIPEACTDVDECKKNVSGCSHFCVNNIGSYNCLCKIGYYLSSDKRNCEDTNECSRGDSYVCGSNSKCTNTNGGYVCQCKTGFASNSSGRYCRDKNECLTYHGCEHTCVNTYGSYRCTCNIGHFLASDGLACTDHDECLKRNGGCIQKCNNYPGGYNCSCHQGYKVSKWNSKGCTDVNECTTKTSGCSQICTNTRGSFSCSCRAGYILFWDRKTCSDIDECEQNKPGCSHICVNMIGSYHCKCRSGFDLSSDKKSCEGKPCHPVYAPLHGSKKCDGYITDSVCNFLCEIGFKMNAVSSNRTCLASKVWSGLEAVCHIIVNYCDVPRNPDNGFIYQPCYQKYESRCELGCEDSFYLPGKTKITCTPSKTWIPSMVTCEKTEICKPNPCLRNGTCSLNNYNERYSCDCSNTGYKGQRCETGEIITPNYPLMVVGQTSEALEFSVSTPSEELVITLSGIGLTFDPAKLVFKKDDKKKTMKMYTHVTALHAGFHSITYGLSGASTQDYEKVNSDLLLVSYHRNISGDIDLDKLSGCYQTVLYKCPDGDLVNVSSTSKWSEYGDSKLTSGIVHVHNKQGKLPLSFSGTSLPTSPDQKGSDLTSVGKACDQFAASNISLLDFAFTRAQEKSFASSIQKGMPDWINITFPEKKSSNDYYKYQARSVLLSGKQLKDQIGGYNDSLKESKLFLVQFASSHAKLSVGNDSIDIPQYGKSAAITLATGLCGKGSNLTLLALPTESMSLVRELNILDRLRQVGWNLLPRSVQFLQNLTNPFRSYFNGTGMEELGIANGTMAMQLEISKKVIVSDSFNSTIEFNGTATAEVGDLDQLLNNGLKRPVNVQLEGKTKLQLDLDILSNSTRIVLEDDKGSSFMQFQGRNETTSNSNHTTKYKLLVNTLTPKNPFESSVLGKYVKPRPNNISVSMDASDNVRDFNNELKPTILAFRGEIKDGPLYIPNLDVQIKFLSHNYSNQLETKITATGYQDSLNFSGGLFDGNPKIPLTVNMTLPQNEREPTVTFDAVVNVLGTSQRVQCNVSFGIVSFKGEITIHGRFKAVYNASLDLETKILRIDGLMLQGEKGFPRWLSEGASGILERAYDKAKKRYKKASDRVESLNQELKNVSDLHRIREEEENQAKREFYSARDELGNIDSELKHMNDSAKKYSRDLEHLQRQMNELCHIKECEDICQAGKVERSCSEYHEVIVKEECHRTCNKTTKTRTAPYSRPTLCRRHHCLFKHSLFDNSSIRLNYTKIISRPSSFPTSQNGKGEYGASVCSSTKSKAVVSPPPGFTRVIEDRASSYLVSNLKCTKPSQRQHGWWECSYRWTACPQDLFIYVTEQVPYSCSYPCTQYVVKETVKYPCYYHDACATRLPDTRCSTDNAECRKVRAEALALVSNDQRHLAKLIRDFDVKRQERNEKSMELRILEIQKETAANATESVKNLLKTYERALNNSRLAHKEIEKFTSVIRQMGSLLQDKSTSITVSKVSFKTKQSDTMERQFLLPVSIEFTFAERKKITLNTVLDFTKLNHSLQSIQKELVRKIVGDFPQLRKRKRRSVDDETDFDAEHAKSTPDSRDNCVTFSNSVSGLHEVALSLNNLAKAYLTNTKINETQLDIPLNETLSGKLGVDIERNKNNSQESPLTEKLRDILSVYFQHLKDQVDLASKFIFPLWRDSMESLMNQTNDDCSGLADCLAFAVDNIYTLFDNIYTDKRHRVFITLKALDEQFNKLTTNLSITVPDMLTCSEITLLLIEKLSNENIFCLQAPNITYHPPPVVERVVGVRVLLVCSATGDALSYGWKFNGALIDGERKNTFELDSAKSSDEGSYACVVTNDAGSKTSPSTLLVVHASPKIIREPVAHLAVRIGTFAHLECKAETKGSTNITYQWYHQFKHSTNFTALENETFPILSFPSVNSDHAGMYYCVVWNKYGETKSKFTEMEPLRYSLPVPSVIFIIAVKSISRFSDNSTKTYLQDAEHLKYQMHVLVNNVSKGQKVVFDEPRVSSCRIYEENTFTTSLVCNWLFRMKGKNISGLKLDDIRDEISIVRKHLKKLEVLVQRLEEYIDDGQMSFVVDNKRYTFMENTFGLNGFVMVCPYGQSFDQEYLSCINCPSGSYGMIDDDGLTACLECGKGTYQPDQGQVRCASCIGGVTTEHEGARTMESCKDIDECASKISECDHFCTNKIGSFDCSCKTGFKLQPNGKTCKDIDECKSQISECDHVCRNQIGSFTCSCKTGFQLQSNRKTCKDIDECHKNNGGCSHICVNTIASHRCGCRRGFDLKYDNKSCQEHKVTTTTLSNSVPTEDIGQQEKGSAFGSKGTIGVSAGGAGALLIIIIVVVILVRKCRRIESNDQRHQACQTSPASHVNPLYDLYEQRQLQRPNEGCSSQIFMDKESADQDQYETLSNATQNESMKDEQPLKAIKETIAMEGNIGDNNKKVDSSC